MNEFIFGPRTLLRLHQGPLSYIIDRYLELLREQGYAQQSAEIQIRLVAGFSKWLRKNGCGAQEVSAEMLDRYLKYRYRHFDQERTMLLPYIASLTFCVGWGLFHPRRPP